MLVEGEEFAGKTWALAELSASDRVGATYWLDLGEGSADEYGAIPGARYEILEHDGTWASIMAQVHAVSAEAARVRAAQGKPVVLGIDTMTDEWDGLKNWTTERARERLRKRGKDVDPDAEVNVGQDLWNDAGDRHRRLMTRLLRFPGIVVMTARGKEVTEVRDGKPVEGSKTWKVEGHKSLAFDASVWIRMRRDAPPLIVGARSVHSGIKPGEDEPRLIRERPANLLEWVIFEYLKVDPTTAAVRALQATKDPTDAEPDERLGLLNSLGAAADAAGIDRAAIAEHWARERGGEKIMDARDLDGLWRLLAAVRAGTWRQQPSSRPEPPADEAGAKPPTATAPHADPAEGPHEFPAELAATVREISTQALVLGVPLQQHVAPVLPQLGINHLNEVRLRDRSQLGKWMVGQRGQVVHALIARGLDAVAAEYAAAPNDRPVHDDLLNAVTGDLPGDADAAADVPAAPAERVPQ